MELQVLYGNQPVKCALIFTATDQSPTTMKLLWCSLYSWSTFESGGVWFPLEALQLYTVGVCLVSVIIVGLQWSIEVSYECIWSFLVLLIEAVASGQLEEIFVLSGITDL